MSSRTRRRLFVAVPLGLLLVWAFGLFLIAYAQNFKSLSAEITVGMSREEAEAILGRPVLVLNRAAGKGTLLVWTDQFWQVDVRTGPDGRVESVDCVRADSLYRRTIGPPPGPFK